MPMKQAVSRRLSAGHDEMTSLEYALAAGFVVTALLVAVPGAFGALQSGSRLLLAPLG
jgi:Flp pilus assembly pilin Flp